MTTKKNEENNYVTRLKGKSLDQIEYELNNSLLDTERKQYWLTLISHCIQCFTIEYDHKGYMEVIDTRNNLKMTFDQNLIAKVVEC